MGDHSVAFQTCATCGRSLTELNYQTPCPTCGGTARRLAVFDESRLRDDVAQDNEQQQDTLVSASAAMASMATLSARVTIKTHFWLHWSEIALDREAAAGRARQEAEQMRKEDGNVAKPLGRELQAAIVAIVASAFAVDAFYGAIKPLILIPPELEEAWKKNATPRHARVFETLKIGFSFGKAGMRWAAELGWLFNTRDGAVHFEENSQEPQLHPTGTQTAPELITYSFEATRHALDLLTEILDVCSRTPRASLPPVVAQMLAVRPSVERILAERSEASGSSQRPS